MRRVGNSDSAALMGIVLLVLFVCLLIGAGCWGYPRYGVYSAEMHGKAKLAEAESSKQVQIEDAKGKEAAAKMLASAEVERGKGVAEFNRIVGTSLKDHPEYLTYLWIKEVNADGNSVIYVPTEAGLPILEAGRGREFGKKVTRPDPNDLADPKARPEPKK